MEWFKAPGRIVEGMEGAKLLKYSEFGDSIVANM